MPSWCCNRIRLVLNNNETLTYNLAFRWAQKTVACNLGTTDRTGAADVAGAQEFRFMYLCDQKALNLFAHIVLCVYI